MSRQSDRERFGRNITSRRAELGLSKAALARNADVSLNVVYQVEFGYQSPQFATLIALADALAVDPGELFKGLRP